MHLTMHGYPTRETDVSSPAEIGNLHPSNFLVSQHQLPRGPVCCVPQISSLGSERERLLDQLSEARSNGGRLEASLAADAAIIAEVRSRVKREDS